MSGAGSIPDEDHAEKAEIEEAKLIQDNQQLKLILLELRRIVEQLKIITGDE